MKPTILRATTLLLAVCPALAGESTITSPNGSLAVIVKDGGPLSYRVTLHGNPLLADSPLGLSFSDGLELGSNAAIAGTAERTADATWRNDFGKSGTVRDHFNETRIHLNEPRDGQNAVIFDLVVRAYDDGIALRYDLPQQGALASFTLLRDRTGFTFPQDARALGGRWSDCGEMQYPDTRLAALPDSRMCLPLVVETPGATVALAEADVRDWSCMFLKRPPVPVLFSSGVVTGQSPVVPVDVDVSGLDQLVLEVTTGGDNYDFDHAVWADARLVREDGSEVYLSDMTPASAEQGWGQLQKDLTVEQKPIVIRGTPYARGLGTHSPGRLVYQLPTAGPRFTRFKAAAGIADETGGQGSVEFRILGGGSGPVTLNADLASQVVSAAPRSSPWRVVMVGRKPDDLITSNLIANLATSSRIADTSWIKPGVMAWDKWWSVDGYGNTASDKDYIDLAAEMGWPYMLVDWGWCDPVMPGPTPLDPNAELKMDLTKLDLPALFEHARQKNVKVILWLHSNNVNRIGVDKTLATVASWGAAGVKIDFMNSSSQQTVRWYEEVLESAANHKLLVNFHGAYVPTGLARTWPNYITQEGILGNEYSKFSSSAPGTPMSCDPKHHITLPFTRCLLGPGDFTPGGFLNVTPAQWRGASPTQVMGTRARQLALAVVVDSPLLCMADSPANYRGQRGLEFFRDLPTVWDETRVLSADLAKHLVQVRRKGDGWVIAALNDDQPLTLRVPLDFLPPGKFTMRVFADIPGAPATAITDELHIVGTGDVIEIPMSATGGFAAKIQSGIPPKTKTHTVTGFSFEAPVTGSYTSTAPTGWVGSGTQFGYQNALFAGISGADGSQVAYCNGQSSLWSSAAATTINLAETYTLTVNVAGRTGSLATTASRLRIFAGSPTGGGTIVAESVFNPDDDGALTSYTLDYTPSPGDAGKGLFMMISNAANSGQSVFDNIRLASSWTPERSYDSWIGTEFPGATDASTIGPDADHDHDGVPNLVEYALDGRSPKAPDAATGTYADGVLSFSMRPGTTGLTCVIEESEDLGVNDPWIPAAIWDGGAATLSLGLSPADGVKRFARLKVSRP